MKKISLIIFAVVFVFNGIIAQNVDDALRYSQVFYGGTARFMSMGGAFTALGADLSSLSQNPAGLGVFRSSEMTITPQLFHINTAAGFNGITSDYLYNFNLNQAGIVSNIISNNTETGLITLNFGYSFNKTNNLNQSIRIQGTGTTSSMADSWVKDANGWYKDELRDNAYFAYLANNTWLIDTLSGSNFNYGTVFSNYGDNPPSVYGQTIRRLVSYEGFTGEHAISIGGNYSNKIFFGATLGISKLKFTSHYEHLESTDLALASKFENFTYTDHFENTGTGYSLKIGAIIKPIETLRIGLAFHSPTFYKIDEYVYDNITSKFSDGSKYESTNDPVRYNYALTTPFRALAGVAVQIKKFALLSADYEFVDYSIAKFSETGDDYDYSEKNLNIKNSLKSAGNIRLGGEFRFNKLYLRTGYGYYGKAFQPGEDNANMDYSSISFGAGFREQNVSIDFAYTNYKYSQVNVLYPLDSSFDPSIVNLSTVKNLFTVTLGYKFGY
ncbi:MAG: hypothetical protein NT144_00980 [Bacteroidia bacterium]|nr:hypothetical protein [Bacteroidia bacterium]